jgi:Ca2+-dependent lipid-binding protein
MRFCLDQGILRVDLIDGRDILAADRSGKSDPYAVFTLNDQKVFRSQTKKKTLSPDWNETFEVNVVSIRFPRHVVRWLNFFQHSRVGARFEVEVFDWNQIEQAKSLGQGRIDLEGLEAFQTFSMTVPLSTKNGPKGEVRVKLMFHPLIIVKSRKNTSTFSSAGRAMTQVGGIPLGAGKGIVQGMGSAGKTVRSVFKREHTPSVSLEIPPNSLPLPTNNPAGTQASRPAEYVEITADAPPTGYAMTSYGVDDVKTPHDYGMLVVTVLAAKDLVSASQGDMVRPYVVVKVGDKEQKTKHTSKTVAPTWSIHLYDSYLSF